MRALPIVFGYLPIGLAFGVLAATAELSPLAAAAMSVFVFAGSAQLISVGMIGAGAGAAAITATVFLVNLRHLLMSAALAPRLGRLRPWQQVLFAYELTDESFALHAAAYRDGSDPPPGELFALNLTAHLTWVGGTLGGAWLGTSLTFDGNVFGLDYALPAMFVALLVMQVDNPRRTLVSFLAAALALIFFLSGLDRLYIILATILAATAGALLDGFLAAPSTSSAAEKKEGGPR